MENLHVQMLGEFTLSTQSVQISDRDNRSRKLWILLAYLIYHRRRSVTQDELIRILWNEDERGRNPVGALKTVFHRMRTMLDRLWPDAGRELILYQNGGYIWNAKVPVTVDIDLFDRLCDAVSNGRIPEYQDYKALRLYKGDFLKKLSSEAWVIPVAVYYHNCYVMCLLKFLPELIQQEKYNEVVRLCRVASEVEPYDEGIHCCLMKALHGMGDQKGAAKVYKQYSERLYSDFGIMPGEEIRSLYYEAVKTDNGHVIPNEMIMQQLKEESPEEGAMICEYDFFRFLYRAMARSISRSGMAVHIAIFSIEGKVDGEWTSRKLQHAMDMLEKGMRFSLRRGDVAARCSNSQYIIMLPQANYENSCMVCERMIKAYYKKHPHSDADIKYVVCPLRPEGDSWG